MGTRVLIRRINSTLGKTPTRHPLHVPLLATLPPPPLWSKFKKKQKKTLERMSSAFKTSGGVVMVTHGARRRFLRESLKEIHDRQPTSGATQEPSRGFRFPKEVDGKMQPQLLERLEATGDGTTPLRDNVLHLLLLLLLFFFFFLFSSSSFFLFFFFLFFFFHFMTDK